MKLRTLFGAESKDGRGVNISDKGNRVSGMASIKYEEDAVLLCKRVCSHDDNG